MSNITIPFWFIPGCLFKLEYLPDKIIEVLKFSEINNTLHVDIKNNNGEGGLLDNSWNLEHTVWGFERGEYVKL